MNKELLHNWLIPYMKKKLKERDELLKKIKTYLKLKEKTSKAYKAIGLPKYTIYRHVKLNKLK